jgi:PadR family transcriptional regulator, regulatory protein PadR
MREPTYFILAALLDGPLHGYAIARRAGELSDGRVKLSAGTLYGALERLAGEGLVEEHGEDVVGGRRRRYHRLTGAGEAAVAEEAERLHAAATAVRRRLPATPAEAPS